jgi:hypothetical protein
MTAVAEKAAHAPVVNWFLIGGMSLRRSSVSGRDARGLKTDATDDIL